MRFIVLLLLFFPVYVKAAQCNAVFTDPASSYSNDGSIEFKRDAFVRGSDGVLDIQEIDIANQNAAPTCEPLQCTSSGNTTESVAFSSFQFTPSDTDIDMSSGEILTLSQGDYKDIVVGNSADLFIEASGNGVTRLEKLELKNDAEVYLAGGVYWIKQLVMGNRSFIRINAGESVVIYTSDSVDIKNDAFINPSFTNPASTPDQLLLVSYDSVVLGNRSIVNGFIFAREKIEMKNDAIVYGAINAKEMVLNNRAFVVYDPDALEDLDGGSACSGGVSGPNRYRITYNSPVLTCDQATITVLACADESCNTPFTATSVAVSVTDGNGGRQTQVFSGQTNFTITRKTEGLEPISFLTESPESVPVNSTLCDGACSIEFVNAGLVLFDAQSTFASPLADVRAEDSLSRIGIAALQDPGDDSGVCVAALEGPKTLDLSYDCIEDGTGYSSNVCRVPFAGIPVNGDGAGVSSGEVNITFNNAGVATLAGYRYADAGRLLLTVSGEIDGADLTVTDASDADKFDSIPDRLELGSSLDENSITRAAAEFSVSLQALGTLGSVLPGYQPSQLQGHLQRRVPSSPSAAEARLTLTGQVLISTTNGDFSPITLSFNEGIFSTEQAKLNENGSYSLEFQDLNYLGNAAINTFESTPPNTFPLDLGRFIPAYFEATANSPIAADACSSFTYIGQAFGFDMGAGPMVTLIAKNSDGDTTRNYDFELWSLTPSPTQVTASSAYAVTDNSTYPETITLDTTQANLGIEGIDNYDGAASFTFNDLMASYTKTAAAAAGFSPFDTDFDLTIGAAFFTDTSFGIGNEICIRSGFPGNCESLNINDIGSTRQHYGRISIRDTYGPETRSLRMPIVAEHLVNGVWAVNTEDNCTPINFEQSAGEVTLENVSSESYESDIAPLYNNIQSSGTLQSAFSGTDDFVFLAPVEIIGNQAKGRIRLTLEPGEGNETWSEFLNFDWNSDNMIDTNDKPSAIVSFGQFRGNDRLLNWRELR